VSRILIAGCLACLVPAAVRGQDGSGTYRAQVDPAKVPLPQPHFQPEYTFDAPGDPLRWSRQPKGLNVSFASTDQAYLRSEVPDLPQDSRLWTATGWKGERLNTELVIWSPDTVKQIRVGVSDLVNGKGEVLAKSNLHAYLARYVVSNYPYGANEVSCGPTDSNPPYLMPDRLEPFQRFDLPGRSVRPIWLSLTFPPGRRPACIAARLQSAPKPRPPAALRIQINVQDQTLPHPVTGSSGWIYGRIPGRGLVLSRRALSDAHKALLKQHLRLYADAGGKYITTYAVQSPWGTIPT